MAEGIRTIIYPVRDLAAAKKVYGQLAGVHQVLQALEAAGAETHQPITDVGGGKLIAIVKDADANLIGLLQSPGA